MAVNLIDPNDEIRGYTGQEGSVGVPLEDLVPYANLRVIMPGRSVIVDDTAEQTQQRRDIGFLVPSKVPPENKGKLGTSWTEIGGLSGFMKGDDGQYTVDGLGNLQREGTWGETFGIQDISVKLNASFEPQVFITFVDVRGASLMEPGLSSPYAAFFHMPYPLFTLDLKGYYGKGISYKLHLMKFNSKFEADTGNFIITCEFIGFTFTYLADLAAIYADVGPDIYGQYVESNPDDFETVGTTRDQYAGAKPWPEGTMTLGTYITNIADMAAKMEAVEEDENAQDVRDLTKARDSLKRQIGYWKDVVVKSLRPDRDGDSKYTYNATKETLTVTEVYTNSEYPEVMCPDSEGAEDEIECRKKRAENRDDLYLNLYYYINGYTSGTNNDEREDAILVAAASGAYRPYVRNEQAEMPDGAKQQLDSSDEGRLPNPSDIKTFYVGPVKWDHDNTVATDRTYGDGQNPTYDPQSDTTTATDSTAKGCVYVNAEPFLLQARKSLRKCEILLSEARLRRQLEEEEIRLQTLVMPPTLENVFKLILNGVDGFNTTLTNVGKIAERQHQEDSGLREKLRRGGTGTDIKESSEKVYPFPLVYKTVTDGQSSRGSSSSSVTRTQKVFPGAKTAGGGGYVYPDYTTSPYLWPEITFVERLINTLIEKTQAINTTFDPDSDEFSGEGGYAPATVEETPPSGNPYQGLLSAKKEIIPLIMLRTMLRLGNMNHFPVNRYSTLEDDRIIKGEDDGTGSLTMGWYDFGGRSATLRQWYDFYRKAPTRSEWWEEMFGDAMAQIGSPGPHLGTMEAETLIAGLQDSPDNSKLQNIYTLLTGNSASQDPDGARVRSTASIYYKEAGYDLLEEGNCGTNCTYISTTFGNAEPVIYDEYGRLLQGTYSYGGVNFTETPGNQITIDTGFWLPNVKIELAGDINYYPCTEEGFDTSASVCPDFWITDKNHDQIMSTPVTQWSESTQESLSNTIGHYYGQAGSAFAGQRTQFKNGGYYVWGGDNAGGEEYGTGDKKFKTWQTLPVPKYKLGKMGTVDYDWETWLEWDFYSHCDINESSKRVSDGTRNDETSSTHMTPDQWTSFSILYSDPSKVKYLTSSGQGRNSPDWWLNFLHFHDSESFMLEDALFMKNDWENEAYNGGLVTAPNVTEMTDQREWYLEGVETGDYEAVEPNDVYSSYTSRIEGTEGNSNSNSPYYTIGADTAGYNCRENETCSGIVDPRKASNLALAYLFINNSGRYVSLKYMRPSSEGMLLDQYNIGKLLQVAGGYQRIPRTHMLMLGSLWYRYDEGEIIQWPNFFNTTGKGSIGNDGINWGTNTAMYQIPRIDERPMPEPYFKFLFMDKAREGDGIGLCSNNVGVCTWNNGNWSIPNDWNNSLHFVAGGWTGPQPNEGYFGGEGWGTNAIGYGLDIGRNTGAGCGPWAETTEMDSVDLYVHADYCLDLNIDDPGNACSFPKGRSATNQQSCQANNQKVRRIYEKLPAWFTEAPTYLREIFKKAFVSWATEDVLEEGGSFEYEPSFPSIKSLMKETTTLPDLRANSGNTQKCDVGSDYVETNLWTSDSPTHSRLYTTFCSNKYEAGDRAMKPYNPLSQVEHGEIETINRGICTHYANHFGGDYMNAVEYEGNGVLRAGGIYEGEWYSATRAADMARVFTSREYELRHVRYNPWDSSKNWNSVLNFSNNWTNRTARWKDGTPEWGGGIEPGTTGGGVRGGCAHCAHYWNRENYAPMTNTLPLLWNGWTNMKWQGDGEMQESGSEDSGIIGDFFGGIHLWGNQTSADAIDSYEDLQNYANSKKSDVPKHMHETLGMASPYFYIRKASHTPAVRASNGGYRQSNNIYASKDISDDPVYTYDEYGEIETVDYSKAEYFGLYDVYTQNNQLNGFDEVGNEVYKNIHFQETKTVNEYIKDGKGYEQYGRCGSLYLYGSRQKTSTIGEQETWTLRMNNEAHPWFGQAPKGEGSLGDEPKHHLPIPTFYVPPQQYLATTNQGNAQAEDNELYKKLKTFMDYQVSIKNPSWRYWYGLKRKTKEEYVDTVWTQTNEMDRYFASFAKRIKDKLNEDIVSGEQQTATIRRMDLLNDNDIKLDTYLTVKNIHDKWLCEPQESARNNLNTGTQREAGKIGWLFDQFSFVDRSYNDIRQKYIDPSPLLNLKKNPKISLYTLIYDLIAHNKFEFFPLPSNIEFTPEEFASSFRPFLTVNEADMNRNPRFYVMYMGGFSDSLDVDSNDYEYSNDGFDIDKDCIDCPTDFFGESKQIRYNDPVIFGQLLIEGDIKCESGECSTGEFLTGPVLVPRTGNWVCKITNDLGGCKIKEQNVTAFRVAFGQDNQNFFKSISLDQAEFQETQESLELIDALAKEEGNSKDPMLKGQNLYNVYQKRSYSCTVDAFGMMNILPLQYFQLDHVPMFHGAYMITNVEHSVTPGEFATSFKGTRISRTVVPYVDNFITHATIPSDSPVPEGEQDTAIYGVYDGDVERIGCWMDYKLGDDQIQNAVDISKLNSVGIRLNRDWPNVMYNKYRDGDYLGEIGETSPIDGETVTCATKWKGKTYHWQPINTGSNTYSPNAHYSLKELQEICVKLAEKNVFIFIWLYYTPNKSYIEPMVGGTGIEDYNPATDWVDWDTVGFNEEKPMSLPTLVKKIDDYCNEQIGRKCISAVEFDLEKHYTHTGFNGTSSTSKADCWSSWNRSGPYVMGYDGVESCTSADVNSTNCKKYTKKNVAEKVMKKLRSEFAFNGSTCQIGVSMVPQLEIGDNDTDYWKNNTCPEFAIAADYVAPQAYSYPLCEKGSSGYCKECGEVDGTQIGCSEDHTCRSGSGGVYVHKNSSWSDQALGKRYYDDTKQICMYDPYDWDGWAGPGANGLQGRFAKVAAKLQASTWLDWVTSNTTKPEFVCGLAGYSNKWFGHTAKEAAVETWNGCVEGAANAGIAIKEIRYWSYLTSFSGGGKGGKLGRMAEADGEEGLFPYGWSKWTKERAEEGNSE